MLQSFHNSQHFMIHSQVILLGIIKLLIIICYRVEVLGSCVFLEKYGTKHFGAGVSVYFHLGVSTTIVNLKHRLRYHAIFKFFKHLLA